MSIWADIWGDIWGPIWDAAAAEPAQQPAGRSSRRWVRIGNKVYKATDQELQQLLAAEYTSEVLEVPKPAKPAKAVSVAAKVAKSVTESVAKPVVKPAESVDPWDDEPDIEFLLLH